MKKFSYLTAALLMLLSQKSASLVALESEEAISEQGINQKDMASEASKIEGQIVDNTIENALAPTIPLPGDLLNERAIEVSKNESIDLDLALVRNRIEDEDDDDEDDDSGYWIWVEKNSKPKMKRQLERAKAKPQNAQEAPIESKTTQAKEDQQAPIEQTVKAPIAQETQAEEKASSPVPTPVTVSLPVPVMETPTSSSSAKIATTSSMTKQTTTTSASNQSTTNSANGPMGTLGKKDRAWILAGDFLLWTTNMNMISAIDANVATGSIVNAQLHLKRPSQKWDPGVRLTLGNYTGYDNWDVQGAWTYFYNSTKSSNIPLEVDADGQDIGFSDGGTKFSFQYNVGDLNLGKSYFISPSFFIRPFAGIHAVWTAIGGSYSLGSNGNVFNSGAEKVDANLHYKIDTWGVGPIIGFNTNWGKYRGFSMLGNIAGSLVYGKLTGDAKVHVVVAPDTDVTVNLNDSSYWQLMPTLQIQFGVSYCAYFGKTDNQFRVNAMWESNFLWEAANLLIFDKSISMQGLTLSMGFTF